MHKKVESAIVAINLFTLRSIKTRVHLTMCYHIALQSVFTLGDIEITSSLQHISYLTTQVDVLSDPQYFSKPWILELIKIESMFEVYGTKHC